MELAPTSRHSDQRKDGCTEHEAIITDCVKAAFIISRMDGRHTGHIAERLGVSRDTVERWVEPSCERVIPMRWLAAMLFDASILSPAARKMLWDKVGLAGGMEVRPSETPEVDRSSVGMQTLEIAAALGSVSGAARIIEQREGDGGVHVTPKEALETLPLVEVLRGKVETIWCTLRSIVDRGEAVHGGKRLDMKA